MNMIYLLYYLQQCLESVTLLDVVCPPYSDLDWLDFNVRANAVTVKLQPNKYVSLRVTRPGRSRESVFSSVQLSCDGINPVRKIYPGEHVLSLRSPERELSFARECAIIIAEEFHFPLSVGRP